MGQELILSAEEQALAAQYLAKLERRARNYNRDRWLLALLAAILLIFGCHCFLHFWRDIHSSRSIVDYLKEADRVPGGTLPKYWFVNELRRTALVFEKLHAAHSLAMLEGLIGTLFFSAGAVAAGFLVIRWKQAPRLVLLAKILRAKWNDFLQDQASADRCE